MLVYVFETNKREGRKVKREKGTKILREASKLASNIIPFCQDSWDQFQILLLESKEGREEGTGIISSTSLLTYLLTCRDVITCLSSR